jgi:hypothetical protein
MSGPDFGAAIIRASLLGAGLLLVISGTDLIQRWIGVVLLAWLAASTAWPPARRALIRRRAAAAARRGDGWMADAARAETTVWRAHCQREAAAAYGRAADTGQERRA